MIKSRWPSLLSLLAGVLSLGAAVSAHSQPESINKLLIYPDANDSVDQLKSNSVTKVIDYGSFWVIEATDTQVESLKKTHGDRLVKANYFNKLELGNEAIDTGLIPSIVTTNLPAGDAAALQGGAGDEKRLRLIQFAGPVMPEWLEQLKAIGRVKLVSYIPNNAYLVQIGTDGERRLAKLMVPKGPIQWVGDYRPDYKLRSALAKAVGTVEVRVAVLNDSSDSSTVRTIQNYAVQRISSRLNALQQTVITLKVNASDITAIAALPEVLWMERSNPMAKMDENQGLILANQPPGSGGATNYLEFLLNTVQISTTPSRYPVVEIADSGIDERHRNCIGPTSRDVWHPAFYTASTPIALSGGGFGAPDGANCCPHPTRIVYNTQGPDFGFVGDPQFGHGTFVASIVAGLDIEDNELIDCYTQSSVSILVTQTITQLCVTNSIDFNFLPCVGPVPPACCATERGCPAVNLTCSFVTNSVFSNACIIVTNAPSRWFPRTVLRRVGGKQLGLGISPFGRIGASPGGAESNFPGPETALLRAYINTARIVNNSWGEGLVVGENDGYYSSFSQSYDALVRDSIGTGATNTPGPTPVNQEMIVVFAGGNNNGVDGVGGFGDVLVTPPATAKNVITVGASAGANNVATYTSFGPTEDGRVKPEVIAPGTVWGAWSQTAFAHPDCGGCNPNAPDPFVCEDDFSVYPTLGVPVPDARGGLYVFSQGTSFAAPAVSGGAQLLWWYFQNKLTNERGQNFLQPSPAMAKAWIVNSARYLPIQNPITFAIDTLPSIAQGFGMMDLGRMFDGIPRVVRDQSPLRAIDSPLLTTNTTPQQTFFSKTGQSYELSGQVASNGLPFRVTLAWTDTPGNPTSFKQLVNDLDLQVIIGSQLYRGNVFVHGDSVTGGAADDINNLECVFLPPGGAVVAGAPYRIIIRALNVPGDGVPNLGNITDQDFALVVYNSSTNAAVVSDIPKPGVNDTCVAATELLAFPYNLTATLTKNDYSNVHPSPTAGRGGVEAFWRIPKPTVGTIFDITTAGSGFANVLSIWRGNCGQLVEEVSNFNGTESAVSFVANGTEDYYIVVDAQNDNAGGALKLGVVASAPKVVFDPSALDFGDQVLGTIGAVQVATLQNNLTVPVEIISVTIEGDNPGDFELVNQICEGNQLAPGGTCTVTVRFAPTTTGVRTAQLRVYDTATGSPRILPLTGNGLPSAPLICAGSTSALEFSNTAVGELSAAQSLILTNCGSADLNITNAVFIGAGSNDFTVTAGCIGSPIPADGYCTNTITFAPTTNGLRAASLRIFSDAGSVTVGVQGTGFIRTPAVCLSRTTVNFGGIPLTDSSDPLSVTVTNCGTTNLVISGVGIVGPQASEFALTANTCSLLTTGQTCQVSVTFTPTATGIRTATLAITNNAAGSPHLITLTGGGSASQPDAMIGRASPVKVDRATSLVRKFLTDDLYEDASGTNQTLRIRVARSIRYRPARFYIVTQNDGTSPEAFRISGGDNGGGFTVRYFLGARVADSVEVTDLVKAGTLDSGAMAVGARTSDSTMLRVEISASTNVLRGTTNTVPITVTSTSDATKSDTVHAEVIAR